MNVNIGGTWVTQASYQKARNMVASKQEGSGTSPNEVKASLQQAMQGWNFSTSMQGFNGSGLRNIAIHPGALRKAANDPEEMVRLKAFALDGEKANANLRQWEQATGLTLKSFGVIIDADGNMSSWSKSINRTGAERRSLFDLPGRPSWAELMRRHLESLRVGGGVDLLNVRRTSDNMIATIESMRGIGRGNSPVFGMTRAVSGNENLLRITSVDANRLNNVPPQNFTVDVLQIATAQRNEGNALTASDLATDAGFDLGDHQISLYSGGRQFNFNFTVSETDTARDVQQRIADAINARSNAGVTAQINYNSDTGMSTLILESSQTGVDRAGQSNFTLNSAGNALSVLGVGNITQAAQNAEFRVNRGFTGALQTSRTNEVDLGHGINAELRGVGQIQVTMARDESAQVAAMREFVASFNAMVEAGGGGRLSRDLARLAGASSAALARVGITADRSGILRIDERRMNSAAESGVLDRFVFDGGHRGTFGFINRVGRIAENVNRNPARFVNNRGFATAPQPWQQPQRQVTAPNQIVNSFTNTGLLFETVM